MWPSSRRAEKGYDVFVVVVLDGDRPCDPIQYNNIIYHYNVGRTLQINDRVEKSITRICEYIKPSARVEYPAVDWEPAGEISYSVLNATHMRNIIANKIWVCTQMKTKSPSDLPPTSWAIVTEWYYFSNSYTETLFAYSIQS